MNVTKTAIAGTLESSDVLVRIFPAPNLEIEINSTVAKQFGQDIENTVKNVLNQLGVTACQLIIEDNGALDCVLQARLKAALLRATDENVEWETLL